MPRGRRDRGPHGQDRVTHHFKFGLGLWIAAEPGADLVDNQTALDESEFDAFLGPREERAKLLLARFGRQSAAAGPGPNQRRKPFLEEFGNFALPPFLAQDARLERPPDDFIPQVVRVGRLRDGYKVIRLGGHIRVARSLSIAHATIVSYSLSINNKVFQNLPLQNRDNAAGNAGCVLVSPREP